jgi:hypothetical protein
LINNPIFSSNYKYLIENDLLSLSFIPVFGHCFSEELWWSSNFHYQFWLSLLFYWIHWRQASCLQSLEISWPVVAEYEFDLSCLFRCGCFNFIFCFLCFISYAVESCCLNSYCFHLFCFLELLLDSFLGLLLSC